MRDFLLSASSEERVWVPVVGGTSSSRSDRSYATSLWRVPDTSREEVFRCVGVTGGEGDVSGKPNFFVRREKSPSPVSVVGVPDCALVDSGGASCSRILIFLRRVLKKFGVSSSSLVTQNSPGHAKPITGICIKYPFA